MASIEREVEKGLLNVVSGISGVNFYTSERSDKKLLPNLVAKAVIGEELLGPFTGVFKVPTTLTLSVRADTNSKTSFDSKYQSIVDEFYRSPELPSYLTNVTSCTIYLAKITSESPQVMARNRTWSKTINFEVNATASK